MRLDQYFRDPVSGLTHLLGALLGGLGLAYLLAFRPAGDTAATLAILVYGISLILLYLASALYHLLHVSVVQQALLRRLDHAMIPVFIAGSYTPFCLLALRDTTVGAGVLIAIWVLALFGLLKSIFWLNAPRAVTAGLFVAMGWMMVVAILPLSRAVSLETLWLMIAGGVAYSSGAVVYAKKWPDPYPPVFGFHEVWHLFVLSGSALHFVSIATLLPA